MSSLAFWKIWLLATSHFDKYFLLIHFAVEALELFLGSTEYKDVRMSICHISLFFIFGNLFVNKVSGMNSKLFRYE